MFMHILLLHLEVHFIFHNETWKIPKPHGQCWCKQHYMNKITTDLQYFCHSHWYHGIYISSWFSKFFMQNITKWLMSICSIHVEEHNDKSYPTIWTDCGEERQVFLMFIFKHQQHCSNFHFVLRHAHNKAYGCRKIPEMAHFLFVNGVYTKF